ncbi:MAG: NADH:ubiquinone oxidoreductase subunit K [Crocinitomix sp.]|jgi:NADH:ubiquinone oxidoreductase subunit K
MKTDLSDLLAQKDFEELTATEQELVLSEISEQEYCEQRKMVATAKNIMATEAATLQAPMVAVAASNALQNKKGGVFAVFAHKVPTWAAVAACAILFTLFGYSGFFGQNVENNKMALIPQIDTVFVEKIITEFRDLKPVHEERRSIKVQSHSTENVVKIDTPAPLNNPDKIAYSDEMLNAERINYTALLQNHSSSAGVSLQNDSISQMVNRTVY